MPILRRGSKGQEVSDLQGALKHLGFYRHVIDETYGPKTQSAVTEFQRAYLADGIADEITLESVNRAFDAWTKKALVVHDPEIPKGLYEVTETFGVIEWQDIEGGRIRITNGWAEKNIVTADFPVVGRYQTHKLMAPVFRAALQEVKDQGLDGEIESFWIWSPRHKMHDPRRGLSMHSWGIACDINWATNQVGTVGDLHPEIVAIFERHGFRWGGRWSTPDPMHFERTRSA